MSVAGYDLSLNTGFRVNAHRVGEDSEPVLVIDGIMRSAQSLVDYAATEVCFSVNDDDAGYPGVRAPAPLVYVEALGRSLDPVIRQAFGLKDVVLAQAECNFSMVTKAPETLKPIQRIPHVDTLYPLQFAVLHYLCDGDFGGTAFYRHSASACETLTTENNERYIKMRDSELIATPPPPGYIGARPQHYTQTAAFEAQFNRLLIYRSCRLHCGLIPKTMPLVPDPRKGRLTANIFMNYRRS